MSTKPQTPVEIYTDGAAEPTNPGPGGYGVVLKSGTRRKELSRGFKWTTNNRMELLAVIVGLEALKGTRNVTVYSDSKYVVDAVEKGWVNKWQKKNWKNGKAKNIDLWKRFLLVKEKHNVRLKWIPGHTGIPENEKCDRLAVEASKSDNLLVDEGYENSVENSDSHTPKDPETSQKQVNTNTLAKKTVATITNNGTEKLCRHCGKPLVKKTPKRKNLKPKQTYYFKWYWHCQGCRRMYMADEAKVHLTDNVGGP